MYNYLTPLEVGMSYEDVQVKQLGNGYELTKPLDVKIFRRPVKGSLFSAVDQSLDCDLQGWGHTPEIALGILVTEYDDAFHKFIEGPHFEIFREVHDETWERIQEYVDVSDSV